MIAPLFPALTRYVTMSIPLMLLQFLEHQRKSLPAGSAAARHLDAAQCQGSAGKKPDKRKSAAYFVLEIDSIAARALRGVTVEIARLRRLYLALWGHLRLVRIVGNAARSEFFPRNVILCRATVFRYRLSYTHDGPHG